MCLSRMARPADVIVHHHAYRICIHGIPQKTRAEPTRINRMAVQPAAPPTSRVSFPQLVKKKPPVPHPGFHVYASSIMVV